MQNKIIILRPGGNDTALIQGIPTKKDRKKINDLVMQQFPNVEQVGFYKKGDIPRLEMAGGEFCGNATRSFAYLLLNGKVGKVQIRVSGSPVLLQAGVNKINSSFAQMPIYRNFNRVKKLDKNIWQAEIKGITHLLTPFLDKDLKKEGQKLLKKYNLLQTVPASGVMFYTKLKDDSFKIDPIVWVRDLQTLFYETACASGTTALGLMLSKQGNQSIKRDILQPSGQSLSVSVSLEENSFKNVFIEGPIKILEEKEVNFYE